MGAKLNDYKEGSKDISGRVIESIILLEEEKYVIYLVKGDYITACMQEAEDYEIPLDEKWEELQSSTLHLNPPNKKHYEYVRRSIADSMVMMVKGHNNVAYTELNNLIEKITNNLKIVSVFDYLIPSVVILFLASALTIAAYTGTIVISELMLHAIFCLDASLMGSILNHLISVKDNKVTSYCRKSNILDSSITNIRAMISGLLIYLIILSNLMLGNFKDNIAAMIVITFISGYNKDTILTVIKKLSKLVKQ